MNAAITLYNAGKYPETKALAAGMDCAALGPDEATCRAFLEAVAQLP